VILMPETDQAGARGDREPLREALYAAPPPPPHPGSSFKLTASFGVATYPSDGDDARTLLDAADRAMYVGKAKGRNVVVVAQERPQ